ncbi:hypothetical protein AB0J21_29835 [Streptomyces sp. NPDC049954]|uniref:hypothetical protein n=1 Tax=Streptomyces sp. NPDC049954 TaxID=3155779 RepID=UPI00342A633A
MYERRASEPPRIPPAPLGATAATRPPGEIKVGDYLFVGDAFRRIADMRSDGGSRRTLIFNDHRPVTVNQSTVTYRPPNRT